MAALDAAAITEKPGVGWCRAWTERVDATVLQLLDGRRGVAVVALGGYARRELCPASDIDLLLLHDGWGRTDLESLVQQLCYPLWDARLQVGHAVHTPAEAVKDAGDRIDTATAILDRRLVGGERGLYDALTAKVKGWTRKHGTRLVGQLAAADAARHRESGPHPGMLEPDLKNGAGGLRDLHSLRWAAGGMLGETTLDALVAAGYLGFEDRRRLGLANETLLQVRCALHQVTRATRGRDVDVLRLDQQDEVAHLLAGQRGEDFDADGLLREVGLAARTVMHLHDRTYGLLRSDASRGRRRRRAAGRDVGDGLRLDGDLVDVAEGRSLADDPALGLRVIAVAAVNGAHVSRDSANRIAREVSTLGTLPWTADARDALLALLAAGDRLPDALVDADHIGLLSAHLPDWPTVRGRPQRNALHRFDLDTHGAQALAALQRLRHDDHLEALWEGLPSTIDVTLATWLHDVGKAWPGDHSEVGARVAGDWVRTMGFDDAIADRVATLVRLHLLLPDVATRRDLADDDEIAAVAEAVGDVATLDALYLLSLADGRATGPAAWSPWKDSLMATLHARTRVLLRGDDEEQRDPRIAATAFGVSPGQVRVLADQAPNRYFGVADGAQVAAHAALLAVPGAAEAGRVHIRSGTTDDTTVVSVVAKDRPRLVADCAGVLVGHDLNVVEARALTGARGLALDWFTVRGDVDADRLQSDLEAALSGALDVAAFVARPRRRSAAAAPPTLHRQTTEVTVRDDRTLEVEAVDRPGLLYYLCEAVAEAGYSLETLRVTTLGTTVFDVFEVAAPPGAPPLEDLRERMLAAVVPAD